MRSFSNYHHDFSRCEISQVKEWPLAQNLKSATASSDFGMVQRLYCLFFLVFFLVSLWYTRQVLAGLLVITDKALNKDTVFAYFCVSSFPSVQVSFSLIWAQYSFTYKIKLRGNKLYPMIVSILKRRAWGVCFHLFFITFFQVRPLRTDLET